MPKSFMATIRNGLSRTTAIALAASSGTLVAACADDGPASPETAQPAQDRAPAPQAPRSGGGAAERILNASYYAIQADETLSAFVEQAAERAISEHCAACHGATLEGAPGVPNLVDYDWLWGITGFESNYVSSVMELEQTILYGVRNRDCPPERSSYGACSDTRYSEMPGYLDIGMTEENVRDLVEYVIDLSGGEADGEAVARAEVISAVCVECHGADGFGYAPYGGPNLTDDIWLYGGGRETIYDVIAHGRLGECPPWADVLDAATVKALAVYMWNKAIGG